MRLYTFTHFMLSSIQQGIQSGHLSQALINKHIEDRKTSKPLKAIKEWLPEPTIICLNGGNSGQLRVIYANLEIIGSVLSLPFTKFHEDEDSMDGIMTSVGIVVPQRVYDSAQLMRTRPDGFEQMLPQDLHPEEVRLADLLNSYRLAS